MSSVAIITARGGSKRIPKKNIQDFLGKPIISYSIEAAVRSDQFEDVMVSTDSEEIAEVARIYGADIPFMRSEKTSDDFATTADVIEEVLNEYEKRGKNFDSFCCIYPTAPFVTGERLRGAMELFKESENDSLVSVVKFGFPPQRAFVMEGELIKYQYPENANVRSQDLSPLYHDCGQFYICRADSFKKYGSIITPKTMGYIIPEEEVQDIDNMSDWLIAEAKYRVLHTETGE